MTTKPNRFAAQLSIEGLTLAQLSIKLRVYENAQCLHAVCGDHKTGTLREIGTRQYGNHDWLSMQGEPLSAEIVALLETAPRHS